MDPITLVGTVGGLAHSLFNTATKVYNFVDKAANVDSSVNALYGELQSQSRMVNSIERILNDARLNQDDVIPLWEDVDICLQECYETVKSLEERLEGLEAGRSSKTRDLWRQFKLGMRDDEIKGFRNQMQTHGMAMQMALQIITVHLSSSGPQVVLDELDPKIELLLKLVEELPTSIANENEAMRHNHARLRESAKMVASRASIVGSRSTVWAGSEPDLTNMEPSKLRRPPPPSPARQYPDTTGSEYGEPLRPENAARISAWMKRDTFAPLDALHEESTKIGSNESRTTDTSFASGSATLVTNEVYDSDDEELEVNHAKTMLKLARQKFKDGKYPQAETSLKKAHIKITALGEKAGFIDPHDVTLEIAQACFQQDKLDESLELCESVTRQLPNDDPDRIRMLNASHLIAQIQLCKGALDEASARCKQTLKARKRLDGKSEGYYESLALLVTIYEATDDEDEALAYASLLPADFKRPTFKGPIATATGPAGPVVVASPLEAISNRPTSPLTFEALHSLDEFVQQPLPKSPSRLRHESAPAGNATPEPQTKPMTPTRQFSANPREAAKMMSGLSPPEPPASLTRQRSRNFSDASSPTYPSDAPPQYTHSEEAVLLTKDIPGVGQANAKTKAGASRANPRGTAAFGRGEDDANDGRSATSKLPGRPDGKRAAVLRKAVPGRSASAPTTTVAQHTLDLPKIPKLPTLSKPLSEGQEAEAVRILTAHRHDPTTAYFDANHALRWAAEYGHELVVQLLLQGWTQEITKKKFGIKKRDYITRRCTYVDTADEKKNNALHLAATFGHATVCQILLEHSASTRVRAACGNEKCKGCLSGMTALEKAIVYEHPAVVRVFLAKGADLDVPGDRVVPPLTHFAAGRGERESLYLLLAAGLQVETRDADGNTILHAVARKDAEPMLRELLKQGLDINAVNHDGQTPLHAAAQSGNSGMVDCLLEHGADPNAIDNDRRTALHVVAYEGHYELLPYLFKYGIDVEAPDRDGWNALHTAAYAGDEEVTEILLEECPELLNSTDEIGYSAMHKAASSGHEGVVTLLLNHGVHVDSPATNGDTALILAAMAEMEDMVALLIKKKANVDLKGSGGHTAFWHAVEAENTAIAKMLKEAGAEYCSCGKCEGVLNAAEDSDEAGDYYEDSDDE
ncbi:hypothetical protein LTR62_008853 [Meristemomyces frigidus]|uniref:Azaphilone pigments biosynthesis cluster protein L N-terminal domain-containing protein n=1 Tax=Meristemomyces frigidus TaxID=1508187 RepID=A0AAN7TD36_9PEZI|nr:hypothetical protein LTR62_008853 [Meristemomyces frigidus]